MESTNRDYYEAIGLARSASQAQIDAVCIRLGEKYLPDLNPDDPRAAKNFALIEEVYETLGDPAKRTAYDALLTGASVHAEAPPDPARTFAPVAFKFARLGLGAGLAGGAIVLAIGALGIWYGAGQREEIVQAKMFVPVAKVRKVVPRLAQDSYRMLKRIEATTASGGNITEYNRQLAQGWYQVKTYMESPDAASRPEIARAFGNALNAYHSAAAVWSVTIADPDHGRSFGEGDVPLWAQRLRAHVPDLDKFLEQDEADKTRKRYRLKDALQQYWMDASASLKKVEAQFL